MMMVQRKPMLALLGLMALTCSACRPRGGQPVHPVSGSVRVNGQSAERALVVFHPVGEEDPNAARPHGEIGPDGSFKVDAPAGDYLVTVEQWLAGKGGDDPPTNRLPAKYASPKSSGLTAHVEAGPTVLRPFELTR
jgi:hypothetical protein